MDIAGGEKDNGKASRPAGGEYALDKMTSPSNEQQLAAGCSAEVNDMKTVHTSEGQAQHVTQDVESQRPDDPEAAQHSVFTLAQKRYIVFMVAFAGFFSPLSANIYFPALNTLAHDFNVTPARINLTITTYMVFQGLAPTFFGDLADIAGRRPTYLIGFTIYIAACVGIACCQNYASLLVLRCVQSSGSSRREVFTWDGPCRDRW